MQDVVSLYVHGPSEVPAHYSTHDTRKSTRFCRHRWRHPRQRWREGVFRRPARWRWRSCEGIRCRTAGQSSACWRVDVVPASVRHTGRRSAPPDSRHTSASLTGRAPRSTPDQDPPETAELRQDSMWWRTGWLEALLQVRATNLLTTTNNSKVQPTGTTDWNVTTPSW